MAAVLTIENLDAITGQIQSIVDNKADEVLSTVDIKIADATNFGASSAGQFITIASDGSLQATAITIGGSY